MILKLKMINLLLQKVEEVEREMLDLLQVQDKHLVLHNLEQREKKEQ